MHWRSDLADGGHLVEGRARQPSAEVRSRATTCYRWSMAAPKIDELLTLDVRSRLALIAKLWDSVVDDSQALPLADSERELIEQRLKEDDDDPDAAIPWDVARADLLSRR